MFAKIADFIESSAGLEVSASKGQNISTSQMEDIKVKQKVDGKVLSLTTTFIEEIISRVDTDGLHFLQVNFQDGRKLLLTQNLIGFKPSTLMGLDMKRLPKVVTTPDLISVLEAIEEAMDMESHPLEVEVLKRVFSSVLEGGEAIGFDLTQERAWLDRIATIRNSTPA